MTISPPSAPPKARKRISIRKAPSQQAPAQTAVLVAPAEKSRSTFAAYVELTKPRITLLLLITCIAGMMVAEHGLPALTTLLITSLGLAMSSGGASALNHVLDRDIDQLMTRTARRPVACGQITALNGTIFGIALMTIAGIMLWLLVNPLTSLLALAGGGFYVLGYTMVLKRTTPQNIVIGGAAGAIPPMVGWAGATGEISAVSIILFAIVFLWTPPHFWALALLIKEDYARAGIPMLPVTKGERKTVEQIWRYCVVLVACTLVPIVMGSFGWFYVAASFLLSIQLLLKADALVQAERAIPDGAQLIEKEGPGRDAARGLFLYSMLYLALLFAAIVIDQTILRSSIA